MTFYRNSLEHILAELERIDLLIQLQVMQARHVYASDEEFQGLYIAEEEVDELLAAPAGLPKWAGGSGRLDGGRLRSMVDNLRDQVNLAKAASRNQGIQLRLDKLGDRFSLTEFDIDALLICLAPEIDLRYERLCAYLQDDVTKKKPSVDLVLNLLCDSLKDKLVSRQRFSLQAPLIAHQLLHFFSDPSHQEPPLLGQFLKVDDRIVEFPLEMMN